MAILTAFTLPTTGHPIDAYGLQVWISTNSLLTITYVEIHPTTIDVTGTIVSGDRTNIQTAINTYVFAQSTTSPFVLVSNTEISSTMSGSASKVVSSQTGLAADAAVLSAAKSYADTGDAKKTANRTYLNGMPQNGTAVAGDLVEWIVTLTTASGVVSDYVTTEGTTRTSGGTALLSSIFADSIQTNFIDSTGVFAQGLPTITSNKAVSIPFTKQGFNGVTVVTINVLGSVAMNSIPNGVVVKTRLVGIAA